MARFVWKIMKITEGQNAKPISDKASENDGVSGAD